MAAKRDSGPFGFPWTESSIFPWIGAGLGLGLVWHLLTRVPEEAPSTTPVVTPPSPPRGPPEAPVWPQAAAVATGRTLAVLVLGDSAAAVLAQTLRPALAPVPVFELVGVDGWFSSSKSDLEDKIQALAEVVPNVPGSRTWILAFTDDTSALEVDHWLAAQGYLRAGDTIVYVPAVATDAIAAWQNEVQFSDSVGSGIRRGGILPSSSIAYGADAAQQLKRADGIDPLRSIGP